MCFLKLHLRLQSFYQLYIYINLISIYLIFVVIKYGYKPEIKILCFGKLIWDNVVFLWSKFLWVIQKNVTLSLISIFIYTLSYYFIFTFNILNIFKIMLNFIILLYYSNTLIYWKHFFINSIALLHLNYC